MGLPTATVKLVGPDGVERVEVGVGTGPVDAVYKAVSKAIKVRGRHQCVTQAQCKGVGVMVRSRSRRSSPMSLRFSCKMLACSPRLLHSMRGVGCVVYLVCLGFGCLWNSQSTLCPR